MRSADAWPICSGIRHVMPLTGACDAQVNPPTSVLSATNLAIILVLLLATSAATFWISADRYAKEQLQEIENLRLEAEAREVRPVTEQA